MSKNNPDLTTPRERDRMVAVIGVEDQLILDNPQTTIYDIMKPFSPDDGHKGTFLVLRVAGMESANALKIVKRKYKSWLVWRKEDIEFKRVDDMMPVLIHRFAGQARVIRTALLDISVIETGIMAFKKIMHGEEISDGMWAYATKMAGIRMPTMMLGQESEKGSWEKLAGAVQHALTQRELVFSQTDTKSGMERRVVARETQIERVELSPEMKEMSRRVVAEALEKAGIKIGKNENENGDGNGPESQ